MSKNARTAKVQRMDCDNGLNPEDLATLGLGYKLSRVAQIFQDAGDELLARHNLDRLSWTVLSTIAHGGVTTPGEITKFTKIERTATSRLLKGLEDRGFVRGNRGPSDGRSRNFEPTRIGIEACRRIPDEMRRLVSELTFNLTTENVAALSHLLDCIGAQGEDVWRPSKG